MKNMNWIDDNVAVGDYLDKYRVPIEVQKIDVRDAFDVDVDNPVRLIVGRPILSPKPEAHAIANNMVMYARSGGKILIYCMAGIDRSPFIATLYRMKRYGENFETAYDKVKKARPQTIQHWEWREYI